MTSADALQTVSVVIPAYNEAAFIATLIGQIQAVDVAPLGVRLELLVVDDGSKDNTAQIAGSLDGVRVIRKDNGGKGSAVRAGIGAATGEYLLIQDADLEYDPRDYIVMLEAVAAGAQVVYGSRYLAHGRYPRQTLGAYWGGRALSIAGWVFTGRYLTDTVTALKLFPRQLLLELSLEAPGFELDHEISAKVLARGTGIVEVPIRYYPRSRAEGKKIGLRDWFIAVKTFFRWRKRHARSVASRSGV